MTLDPSILRPKKPGDPIKASDWNELVKLVARRVKGPNVIEDHTGWTILDREGGATAVSGSAGILAAATKYRRFIDSDPSNPLYVYEMSRVSIGEDGQPILTPPSYVETYTFNEQFHSENQSTRKLYHLTDPVNGTVLPDTTTYPTTDLLVSGEQDDSAYADSDAFGVFVGTTPGGLDIDFVLEQPTSTDILVQNVPTDGSTFYITLLSYAGSIAAGDRTYECSIVRAQTPTEVAIHLDSFNWIGSDTLRGPVGGQDPAEDDPGPPAVWTPLDPFLVVMFPVRVQNRSDIKYAFTCPDVEYWGTTVVQGPGGEPSYFDARYWVRLQELANTDSDPYEKFVFANRPDGKDIIVLANNLCELPNLSGEWHKLPTDSKVRVKMTRGGTAPHIPRYWIDSMGPPGTYVGISGAFNLVTRICFDQNNCVKGYVTAEFIFDDGVLVGVNGYGEPCPP